MNERAFAPQGRAKAEKHSHAQAGDRGGMKKCGIAGR